MKTITVTFPNKTAKELVEECDNRLGDGKLLYNTTWYKNEDFYTKEKCREGTREVVLEQVGMGKSWNKCRDLVQKEGGEMLNFAEAICVIIEHYKITGQYPWKDFTWLSSVSSNGRLLFFGAFDSVGAALYRNRPDRDWTPLGSVFSRRTKIINDIPIEEMKEIELDEAIRVCKANGLVVYEPK